MRVFGRRNGGGRRAASRELLPMPALVSTVKTSQVATLVDLSSVGARLRGFNLPRAGEEMSLKIDYVRVFGIVAWSEHGECGVEFDSPMLALEAERLRREAKVATLTSNSLEYQLAFDDWPSR